MMLHESVMLEIYRQAAALHHASSEMTSPRCLSRDSSSGRSPSEDSMYSSSGRNAQSNAISPVAITLPATLPPSAAAALLPPQSAAMAAYLGVAAAAAQQNRLLLGSQLAGLTKSSNSSPPLLPLSSPLGGDTPILDFSTKRNSSSMCLKNDSSMMHDDNSDNDAVNLTKPDTGPLDLSCTRKRNVDESPASLHHPQRKVPRTMDYKPNVVSPWSSPVTPYIAAAVAAAGLSPKTHHPSINEWNGKNKIPATNDATKALEKMSELSRLGGDNDMYKSSGQNSISSSSGSTGRHSAWQSHWLNKGADSTKDVLKCVWCKQSFPTLAAMSTHMKETKHCNVSVPPPTSLAPPPSTISSHHSSNTHSSHSHSHSSTSLVNSRHENSSKPTPSELNMLIKETMPLPRKLVRGQDVWLGKGAEQTRQILKCMWCGQSFRTLAEMTSHMQQTQHYTNIISQEQIISWKSSDGTGSGGGGGSGGSGGATGGPGQSGANSGSSSTVSAVFTCKVCDQAFNSLKDLSNHMVKNSHYKEHIMRSITESGGRRRQTREKRKKSLPVRKLLELERAQHEFKNGDIMPMKGMESASARITCEKCGEKIDTLVFVEHIRQCVGRSDTGMSPSQKNLLKSALTSNSIISPDSIGPMTPNSRDGRKSIGEDMSSPISRHISPANPTDLSSPMSKESAGGMGEKSSSPSVLNAIEQLIEKSFDTKSRHPGFAGPNHASTPLGSSILKRLGIDESVDYTKPLIDPTTMNFLRSYQQHQLHPFGRRERSGSESSSVSERGSSRMDSLTPERKNDHVSQSTTPRTTPDKLESGHVKPEPMDADDSMVRIKKEPLEDNDNSPHCDDGILRPNSLNIKREIMDDMERPESRHDHQVHNDNESSHRRNSRASTPARSPAARRTPIMPSPIPSPASERSVTPRSTPGGDGSNKKSSAGGSLGALSSMFDSLTGSNAPGSSVDHGPGHQKKQSSHPLAALQKLCDKTENNQQSSRTNSVTANPSSASTSSSISSSTSSSNGANNSSSIVPFSWACNDAIVTPESIMKCAFCDTPFISKGAYRHHLSKMHFVKDDVIPDPVQVKSQKQIPPPTSMSSTSGTSSSSNNNSTMHSPKNNGLSQRSPPPNMNQSQSSSGSGGGGGGGGNGSGGNNSNNNNSNANTNNNNNNNSSSFEESPHSKFLKYTELAKQLSSKYV